MLVTEATPVYLANHTGIDVNACRVFLAVAKELEPRSTLELGAPPLSFVRFRLPTGHQALLHGRPGLTMTSLIDPFRPHPPGHLPPSELNIYLKELTNKSEFPRRLSTPTLVVSVKDFPAQFLARVRRLSLARPAALVQPTARLGINLPRLGEMFGLGGKST